MYRGHCRPPPSKLKMNIINYFQYASGLSFCDVSVSYYVVLFLIAGKSSTVIFLVISLYVTVYDVIIL